MITFIVTSYNRPEGLGTFLKSLEAQTDQDFETIIVDDNSSNPNVEPIILEFFKQGRRGIYIKTGVQDEERKKLVRYAVNINLVLTAETKLITGNLICYQQDDTELAPDFVKTVHRHFMENPEHLAGYVCETWEKDGEITTTLWNGEPVVVAFCALDMSQVVHRAEHAQLWGAIHPLAWGIADGIFLERLLGRVGTIYPIGNSKSLVTNHIQDSSCSRQPIEQALKVLEAK